MDVSIVVPTLNEEDNIRVCLESIASQETDAEYEIIVCDAKSEDKTVEIAGKYTKKIVSSNVRSIGLQRNLGAKSALGKYILFVDADTILQKGFLEWGLGKFREDPDLLGFSAGFRFSDRSPRFVFSEKLVCAWFEFNDKRNSPTLVGFNTFVTAEAFKLSGGFLDVPLEDADYVRRLHKLGRVHFFTDHYVVTSSRRLETMGVLGSLRYYFELDVSTRHPDLKNLFTYNKYLPYRLDSGALNKAFTRVAQSDEPVEFSDSTADYVQRKAYELAESMKQEVNGSVAWADETRKKIVNNTVAVVRALSYIESRGIDTGMVDEAFKYVRNGLKKQMKR